MNFGFAHSRHGGSPTDPPGDTAPSYAPHMELADALQDLRKKSALTQAQVAGKIGVHVTTVSGWENGHRTPPFHDLMRYLEAVGATLRDLARLLEPPQSIEDEEPMHEDERRQVARSITWSWDH